VCHGVDAAIDEAIASFKKKKPSDRDATRCKLPPAYAAGTLSSPSDETPATFEFKVCDCLQEMFRNFVPGTINRKIFCHFSA